MREWPRPILTDPTACPGFGSRRRGGPAKVQTKKNPLVAGFFKNAAIYFAGIFLAGFLLFFGLLVAFIMMGSPLI
jgi:hypothetical protein